MHSEGQDAGREIGEQALIEWLCTYLCQRRHLTPEQAETLVTDLVAVSRQARRAAGRARRALSLQSSEPPGVFNGPLSG